METYFTFFSIILLIILVIYFWSKKSEYTPERSAYAKLLAANFFGLIIEMVRDYISNSNVSAVILAIANKFYLLYIMFFILLFTLYVFTVFYKNPNNPRKRYFNILKILVYIVFIVAAFTVALMPVVAHGSDFDGTSVDIMYVYSFFWICVWFISMLKNIRRASVKKFIPIAAMIVLMGVVSFFQKEYVDLTIFAVLHTIVIFIAMFTLDSKEPEPVLETQEPEVEMPIEVKEDIVEVKEPSNNGTILSNATDYMESALKSIAQASSNLSKYEMDDAAKEELKKISLHSQTLLSVVGGISDVSKMDMDNIELVDGEYNIKDIIKNVVMLSKAYIGNKPIEFKFAIDSDLPEYLYGDASKVEQICLDLMTNAIKNTPEGEVELKIDSIVKKQNCKLIISVSDTGTGMKKEELDSLFDVKDDNVNEDGLLLSITKALVDKMGGKISVESDYGVGSKFIVSINQKIIEK